jgi:hypothetical protein
MRSLVPWFFVGVAVQAPIALGLLLWGRWVARRLAEPRWRHAAWLPAVALALNLAGAVGAAWLVARTSTSPGPAGPEAHAAWRAQWVGPGVVLLGSAALAAVLYGASTVLSLMGTVHASRGSAADAPAASRGSSAAPRGSDNSGPRGR